MADDILLDWSDRVAVGPRSKLLCEFDNEIDLLNLVRKCVENRVKLRPLGSLYSNSALLKLDGSSDSMFLDMTKLRGVVNVSSDSTTATFYAGTRLIEIYQVLDKYSMVMACSPPVIAEQTIGGAVSTGTHGQANSNASISDIVTGLKFINLDTLDFQFIDSTNPDFHAFTLSLGALGILTQVTFRISAKVSHSCHKFTITSSRLMEKFEVMNLQNEYCKAWWFPDDGYAHVWTSNIVDRDNEFASPTGGSNVGWIGAVGRAMDRMQKDTKTTEKEGKQFDTLTRFVGNETKIVGGIYEIWAKGIPVPQINVEIALKIEKFSEAIDQIIDLCHKVKERTHYPIILRFAGASESWLNLSYQQAMCCFGFVVYCASDGTVSSEGARFVRQAEEILANLGGKPHWGKYFTYSLYDFDLLYPNFEKFRSLIQKYDPREILINPFLGNLFLGRHTDLLQGYDPYQD